MSRAILCKLYGNIVGSPAVRLSQSLGRSPRRNREGGVRACKKSAVRQDLRGFGDRQQRHLPPGVKQQFVDAVRRLVTGQVVPLSPAAGRGPKHVARTGATPGLEGAEWRKLLDPSRSRPRAICATGR